MCEANFPLRETLYMYRLRFYVTVFKLCAIIIRQVGALSRRSEMAFNGPASRFWGGDRAWRLFGAMRKLFVHHQRQIKEVLRTGRGTGREMDGIWRVVREMKVIM